MTMVTITGWREGLNKVERIHLLRQHAGCARSGEATGAVDQLLAGEPLTYEFPDGESASAFRRSAVAVVGAICSGGTGYRTPLAGNGDATSSSSPGRRPTGFPDRDPTAFAAGAESADITEIDPLIPLALPVRAVRASTGGRSTGTVGGRREAVTGRSVAGPCRKARIRQGRNGGTADTCSDPPPCRVRRCRPGRRPAFGDRDRSSLAGEGWRHAIPPTELANHSRRPRSPTSSSLTPHVFSFPGSKPEINHPKITGALDFSPRSAIVYPGGFCSFRNL